MFTYGWELKVIFSTMAMYKFYIKNPIALFEQLLRHGSFVLLNEDKLNEVIFSSVLEGR